MKNLEIIKIPVVSCDGIETVDFCPSQFGDPNTVSIRLPRCAINDGFLIMERRIFAKSLLKDLRP